MWIVCGQYRGNMWMVCDLAESHTDAETPRGMWTVCGQYVDGMWSVCGRYVVSMWTGKYVILAPNIGSKYRPNAELSLVLQFTEIVKIMQCCKNAEQQKKSKKKGGWIIFFPS